jgi:hypothetical protein
VQARVGSVSNKHNPSKKSVKISVLWMDFD